MNMEKTVDFKPIVERVLVQVVVPEERTAAGIVIPVGAQKPSQQALVVAVGDIEGVALGDVVLFARYSGHEIQIEGEDYLVLETPDVLGVVGSK